MLRPSRPFTIVLLWLAIVLLPLRAWAAAAMPVPMAMSGVPATAMHAADAEAPRSAMPCHGGDAQAADAAAPQACSLCGVCHAAFAILPSVQSSVPALAPARPAVALAPAVEAAALAGPERPPRPRLA